MIDNLTLLRAVDDLVKRRFHNRARLDHHQLIEDAILIAVT